ncbi:MAG: hypothetical protein ACRBCS_05995 [Cellvibrionaceae bacterium]
MMKLSNKYERDGMGHIFTIKGVLCGEKLISGSLLKYNTEMLKKLRYQIGDLRDVERVDMTVEQMKEIAHIDCQAARDAGIMKIALVASHELIFSLSSMYSAYAIEPCMEAKMFRNSEDAREWIEGFVDSGALNISSPVLANRADGDSSATSLSS